MAHRWRGRLVDRLSARLPRVGLDGVLAHLDRVAEPCTVPGDAAGEGLTWDDADRDDPRWWPQGVAAVRDGAVLLVSWYGRRRRLVSPGTRISVVDPVGARYRHVLLVAPRRFLGLTVLGRVRVHAGGIAVHRGLLFVADTLFGVRVFRLDDVLRGPGPYGYVLPQLSAYRASMRSLRRGLRWSFLGVGEVDGRPCLVAGEYRRKDDAPPRLARFPLDEGSGLPLADARGRVRPLEVHEEQPRRMQGAAVHGGTWYLTASSGEGVAGDLHVGAPGAWRRHRGVLPTGPEDVDWSRPGERLWCVTEWPGRRWVFPLDTARWR